MHMIEARDFVLRTRTRVMAGSLYNVGLVMDSIIREIVHNTRVEDRRYMVLKRHI